MAALDITLFSIITILILTCVTNGENFWETLNLPEQHLPLFFSNNPAKAAECLQDEQCPFKHHTNQSTCWSYEDDCHYSNDRSYSSPVCPGDHKGWVASKQEQQDLFYSQADFGFVREQRQELRQYCVPVVGARSPSSLSCTHHLKLCRGHNVYLDLRRLATRTAPVRYHTDVLQPGDVGGHCSLDSALLSANSDQISPLQSWGPELRHFAATEQPPEHWKCDVWYDRPVMVVKIDAAVSLYHHFCDFFNLYMSQHVNNTGPDAFSTDVQVLVWETYPYRSSFHAAWRAFTRYPLLTLGDVAGKRLCFREVLFPLLPRMIFGLYYNTPVVWGCENSGLFHAFNRHMLHRMRVPTRDGAPARPGSGAAPPGDGKVRVTLLARQTSHRRVLNEAALVRAMMAREDLVVTVAQFDHGSDFVQQLHAVTATDVLVGMHGAGLTHLLFLPDWAAVLELYNCGDEHCYQDLARLRGVQYYTWEDASKMAAEDEGHHPQLGAHEKFTNYQFDVQEFMRLLDLAVSAVRRHDKWRQYNRDYIMQSSVKGDKQEL